MKYLVIESLSELNLLLFFVKLWIQLHFAALMIIIIRIKSFFSPLN